MKAFITASITDNILKELKNLMEINYEPWRTTGIIYFDAKELAEKLGLHELYLKIWCQTAYFFEILDYDEEDRYKFERFLDKQRHLNN